MGRDPAIACPRANSKMVYCSCTQGALRARNLALPAGDLGSGLAHRNRQRLERALGPVVVVLAAQAVDVQGDSRTLREALQAVGDHLAAKVANLLAFEAEVDDAVGAVGEVDDGAGEGLVERGVGIAEARQTGHAVEGLGKSVTEGDTNVFRGVVVVNY